MNEWLKTFVSPTSTVRDVILELGKHRQKIALVVDLGDRLIGTVTDGDIRRSMLAGVSPERPVAEIMSTDFTVSTPESDREERIRLMYKKQIQHLPIVDDGMRVVALIRLEELLNPRPEQRNNKVVILAGGYGRRLGSLTKKTPKPMLHVGERPILETIVRQLAEYGFSDICISVNHLAGMIKDHFRDGENFGVEIRYIEEEAPLGTAGPLGLIKDDIDQPVIVMNGDLLTKVDFASLLMYHLEHKADATICVREFDMEVPFGVLDMADHCVRGITEKPVHRFPVNAGIYVLEPSTVQRIPPNTAVDMPDFLHRSIDGGAKVVGFPIHEYWIDIGQLDDFSRARSEYPEVFS